MRRAIVTLVFFLFPLFFLSGSVFGQVTSPCSGQDIPPFLTEGVLPNVLIILTNPNTMDEDFYGNGVGSWAADSKSVIARQALQTVVQNLQGYANVGIMSYTLPTSKTTNVNYPGYTSPPVTPSYVYNSLTFASVNKNTYCPSATPEQIQACVNWCVNDANGVSDAADEATCNAGCGSNFTSNSYSYPNAPTGAKKSGPFFDEIILDNTTVNPATNQTEGSAYCATTYPKTFSWVDAKGNTVYYQQADPLYTGSSTMPYSAGYLYSGSGYSPANINTAESNYNSYNIYEYKTFGTADYTGWLDQSGSTGLIPTDADFALGIYNYGQQIYYYYTGPSWFSNSDVVAPASLSQSTIGGQTPAGSGGQEQGYLNVAVGNLSNSTQFNNVYNVLEPNSGTPVSGDGLNSSSCNYMSCNSSRSSNFDMNACTDANGNPYIINAGNSPTAGVLASARDYFGGNYSGFCFNSSTGMSNGTVCTSNSGCSSPYSSCSISSPITASCQKSYVILLTDGLPNTEFNGQQVVPITSGVMAQVTSELQQLCGNTTNNPICGSSGTGGVTVKIGGQSYTFYVPVYVLGIGSQAQESSQFDSMAQNGGTAVNGHAYYASTPDQLTSALQSITSSILGNVASGSSVSILSQGQTQNGANMLQAVFYPNKMFGTTMIYWPGYLYNWWFYSNPNYENIRENNTNDDILNLVNDYGVEFTSLQQGGLSIETLSDPTGSGNPTQAVATGLTLDQLTPLWEAGKMLFATPAASRTIYTPGSNANGSGLVSFNTSNTTLTTDPSPLGSPGNFSACLTGSSDKSTLQNLISYVMGTDISNTFCSNGATFESPPTACTSNSQCTTPGYTQCLPNSCRNRTVGLCSDGNGNYSTTACNTNNDCSGTYDVCTQNVWKLGDILYSTPKVQIAYSYCGTTNSSGNPVFDSNSTLCTSNSNCTSSPTDTQCLPKESLVLAGANDGMLHAFQTGTINNYGLTSPAVDQLTGIATANMGKELWAFVPKNSLPYLRCLASPAGCHLYYNDLSPYITTMQEQTGTDGSGNPIYTTRTVLIGGMRLGGGSETGSGNYCMNSSGVSNGTTCTAASNCSSTKYCLDSAGATNGTTCTSTGGCTSPYKLELRGL